MCPGSDVVLDCIDSWYLPFTLHGASKMHLSLLVALAAVRSKAVLLLLIHCFMYRPLFVGVLCLVLVSVCISLCPYQFCNHLDKGKQAELVALLCPDYLVTVNVLVLFLVVPWVVFSVPWWYFLIIHTIFV